MAFEFFRKYQKPILFTAGLFALITFSITGAVTGLFAPGLESSYKAPRLTLPDGRVVEVTFEDWGVGLAMMNVAQQAIPPILPSLATGDEQENLRERYAALRRLAIEYGIDAAPTEVDRAIEQALAMFKGTSLEQYIGSPTQLARANGYSSLAHLQQVLREAMRISTFLRLQVLATDTSDPALAQQLLEQQELLTLKVAVFDRKTVTEAIKTAGVADDDLKTWIEALPEDQRLPYQDVNHVSLRATGLRYAAFDPAEWSAELGDKQFTDEQLKQEYELRKESHFRKQQDPPKPPVSPSEGEPKEGEKPKEGTAGSGEGGKGGPRGGEAQDPPKPGEAPPSGVATPPPPSTTPPSPAAATPAVGDPQTAPATTPSGDGQQGPPAAVTANDPYRPFEEVKEDLRKMLQAEAALDALRNGKLQERLAEHMRDVIEARNDAVRAVADANTAAAAAAKAAEAAPADAALKQAAEAAKAAVKPLEEAQKAAEKNLDARRAAFDVSAALRELIGPRKGQCGVVKEEPQTPDGLRDLGELGPWDNTWAATSMSADGDLSTQVQKTKEACFHFQVPKVVLRPLKPFDQIKERAQADYFTKKADERAEAAKKLFEERLLAAAKAKIADEVAKIEKEHTDKLATRISEWQQGLQTELQQAEREIATLPARSQIRGQWEARRSELTEQLAKSDAKRVEFESAINTERDQAIAVAARAIYKDVIDGAVADTGFEIKTIGPVSTEVAQRPRFRDTYPADVRFLLGDPTAAEKVKVLKPGEATEVLDDKTDRVLYLVVAEKREPATVAEISRAELLSARKTVVPERLLQALQQSFTLAALKERFRYESRMGKEDEPAVAAPGAPKSGTPPGG